MINYCFTSDIDVKRSDDIRLINTGRESFSPFSGDLSVSL